MRKTHSRRISWMVALGIVLALAGCKQREVLKLHFLRGFVPATRAIFLPAAVAVGPIGGELASGTHDVGTIYNSSGTLEKKLRVSDAGAVLRDALTSGLADAGLKPVAIHGGMTPGDSVPGVDSMLSCEMERLSVEKNFGTQQTIHGQYFTMTSRVKLKFTLRRRDGSTLYENEIVGAEDEPPKPVGGEVFLPLETDPAESLSVAMSRAIGALLLDEKFRAAFPPRTP